jgi:hypothetical protein
VGSVPVLIISKGAGVSSSVCWKDSHVTSACASFNEKWWFLIDDHRVAWVPFKAQQKHCSGSRPPIRLVAVALDKTDVCVCTHVPA